MAPVHAVASIGGCPRRVAVAVLAASLAACGNGGERPLAGYVEGEYLRIAAPFAGQLVQLSVRRGDDVAAGAPLFALERDNEVAARRQAEQQQQAAQARLANLQTGRRPTEIEAVAQQLREAAAARDLAVTNLRRTEKLHKEGFVSPLALDESRTRVAQAEATVQGLQATLATAKLPARVDEIRAAEADAKAAREALAQADWRLAQRALLSPAAGRVHDTYYSVGDWVPAGSPVASLLPPGNVRIRFYVAEPALGGLRIGQPVTVGCDGCPAPVPAKVVFVSDRAEFTPPVLYSRDNRAKLVFRVEAQAAPADAAKLHPGQPVDVAIAAR